MNGLLLFALAQVAAQPGGEVVVIGRRDAAAAVLRACVARRCPPAEDVAASLALAERQVEEGAYHDARRTLREAIGRNRRFAGTEPVLVAGLWRADSRIAIHVGDTAGYRGSQVAALGTLRGALGSADPRVLAERLEIGDTFGHLGDYRTAAAQYRAVAEDADRAGHLQVRSQARLRLASLYVQLAAAQPGLFTGDARRAVATLRGDDGPSATILHQAADLYATRLAVAQGDDRAVDRLVALARTVRGSAPMLVYAPPIVSPKTLDAGEVGFGVGAASGLLAEQWVDIGFAIDAAGRVEPPAVLRRAPGTNRRWVEPVLRSIAGRRYSPGAGGYRIERYTRTAHLTVVTGSRLRVREPVPRIEMLDLTKGSAPAPEPGLAVKRAGRSAP